MCHFISLVVATESDAAVDDVLRRHGRHAGRVENASLAKVLRPGERQYLSAANGCDCGTALARREPVAAPSEDALRLRLTRKGWSAAKIERAAADAARASERPSPRKSDSLDYWAAVLTDVSRSLGKERVGVFLHQYSGGLDEETFTAARRDYSGPDLKAGLATLNEDELLIVSV